VLFVAVDIAALLGVVFLMWTDRDRGFGPSLLTGILAAGRFPQLVRVLLAKDNNGPKPPPDAGGTGGSLVITSAVITFVYGLLAWWPSRDPPFDAELHHA